MFLFVYSGQTITRRVRFTSTPDATPTLSVFVDGDPVGGTPVDGVGAGSTWKFTMTVPSGLTPSTQVQAEVHGVVSGENQWIKFLDGTVVEWTELPGPPAILLPPAAGIPGSAGAARHEVFTLQDIVHSLTLRSGADSDVNHVARMVKAVQAALRSLHAKHSWNYYKQQTRFATSDQIAMEIEYDHEGGVYDRLVTITSNHTWPTDAEFGEVYVGDTAYRVYRKLSDTTATLEPDHSMLEDYTGSAVWKRRAYRFGREILKVEYAHNITANRQITSLPSVEFNALGHSPVVSGYTTHFTWENHGGRFGGSEFILHPAPISKEIIEVRAAVLPLVPFIHSVTGEDLTGNEGSYTINSPSASFSQKLVGSIIRISNSSVPPVGLDSDLWDFQAFVNRVNSPTSLDVSEPLPSVFAGSGYAISSPIDIESSVMLEALEDEAYYQYTKNHDHKQAATAADMARKSLLEAMSRDKRVGEASMDAGSPFWHWAKSDFSQNQLDT